MNSDEIIAIPMVWHQLKQFVTSPIPNPFSITFISCNRKNKTGGDIIELQNCLLLKNQVGRPAIIKNKEVSKEVIKQLLKDPNHLKNQTFNIIQSESQHIFKVHKNLIICFCGKTVIPAYYE
jgi:hypothetical protein